MNRKITALAAVLFAATFGALPIYAISLDSIIENKELSFEVAAPKSNSEFIAYFNQIVSNTANYCDYQISPNSDFTSANLTYSLKDEEGNCGETLSQTVKLSFATEQQTEKDEIVESYSENGVAEDSKVTLSDESFLELAEEVATGEYSGTENIVDSSKEIAAAEEASNTTAEAGNYSENSGDQFDYNFTTDIFVKRDDQLVAIIPNVVFDLQQVIHVPTTTEDSTDAYVEAANDKAGKVLTTEYELHYGGKISEDFADYDQACKEGNPDEYYSCLHQELNTDDYYNLIFSDDYYFYVLIVKDEPGKGESESEETEPAEEGTTETEPSTEEEQEEATEETTETETLFEGEELEASEGEPEDLAATEETTNNFYVASSSNKSQSSTNKQSEASSQEETTKEEPKKADEKKEEKTEDESKEGSNPLPIIIIVAIVAGIVVFFVRKANSKKYSK
jgi:hypothetical protein